PLDGSGAGGEAAASPPAPAASAAAPEVGTFPTIGAAASADNPPAVAPQTQAEARQALYADPLARRIFDEFEARLVEVRLQPAPVTRTPTEEVEAEKK
ncbi:MAG TPA: hypothetical protein VEF07_09495, partial [Candidatus Binataceae bacterium]|nr:hypothetical protein [Candidatus Binataceae bacterium]